MRRVIFAAFLLAGAPACSSKPKFVGPPEVVNDYPPVAVAGPDAQALIGDRVVLDGTATSDRDGNPLFFDWTLVESPKPGIGFAGRTASVEFVPTWNGRYVFQLEVSDRVYESVDSVVVDVSCRPPAEVSAWDANRATWAEQNPPPECVDYVVTGDVVVPANSTLTVGPGARVQVAAGVGIQVEYGNFISVGTPEAPIGFEGRTEGRGQWRGLQFSEAPNVQLVYTTVSGGGGAADGASAPGAGVVARGATALLIEHSRITGSAGFGLALDVFANIQNFYDDDFTGNALGAAEVEINQVNRLTADSRYTGNSIERVRVRGSDLNTPSTWSALGVPYVVGETDEPTINIGRDLRIEAGATVQVVDGVGLQVAQPGVRFESWGTAEAPVRIETAGAQAGSWRGLLFANGAFGELVHTLVTGGGGGRPWADAQSMTERANVSVLAAKPKTQVRLTSSALSRSANQGVWIEAQPGIDVACDQLSSEQPVLPSCPYVQD